MSTRYPPPSPAYRPGPAPPPSMAEDGAGAGRTQRRVARLLRGRPGDPAWARPALLGLLLATALLYIVGLSRSGWANEFYAAAVQAGTKSWTAFLFGSLDSSNFITVDKTPAFLWVMELSARIFGLNSWSLLLPQALAGVVMTLAAYATTRAIEGGRTRWLVGQFASEGRLTTCVVKRHFYRAVSAYPGLVPPGAGVLRGVRGSGTGGIAACCPN